MKKVLKNVVAIMLVLTLLMLPVEVLAASQKVLSLSFKTSEDFILGETNANVSFKLQASAKSVKVQIVDSLGKTVMTYNVGSLKANVKKKLTWNGKNSKNKLVAEGYYSVKVVADKTTGKSSTLYARKQKDFAGGNGSKGKPYVVSDIKQLDNVRKYNGKYFMQSKDIDFEYTGIEPLFSEELPFNGTYDGKGFKISNLTITKLDSYETALFICVGAKGKLTNVILDNASITGGTYTAGLVSNNMGTLIYCEVNGTIAGSRDKEGVVAGGVCALNKGNINSCQSSGIVSASKYLRNDDDVHAGGIVGSNYGNVINCKSEMSVSSAAKYEYWNGKSKSFAGGIVGRNRGIINNCIASGSIIAIDDSKDEACYAGGVVGRNASQVVESQYIGSSLTADTVNDIIGYQE